MEGDGNNDYRIKEMIKKGRKRAKNKRPSKQKNETPYSETV